MKLIVLILIGHAALASSAEIVALAPDPTNLTLSDPGRANLTLSGPTLPPKWVPDKSNCAYYLKVYYSACLMSRNLNTMDDTFKTCMEKNTQVTMPTCSDMSSPRYCYWFKYCAAHNIRRSKVEFCTDHRDAVKLCLGCDNFCEVVDEPDDDYVPSYEEEEKSAVGFIGGFN